MNASQELLRAPLADVWRPAQRRGDPLLALIRRRPGLSDGWLVTGVSLAALLVLLGGPAAAATPLARPGVADALLYSLALVPLGAWVYVTLPDRIARLFDTLDANGVIGEPREAGGSYDQFRDHLSQWLTSRWWTLSAVAVVVAYWYDRPVWMTPADVLGQVPEAAKWWLRAALISVLSPVLYGTVWTAARLIVATLFTAQLFRRFRIVVRPMATDGAAGLGALGDFLAFTLLVASALGVTALALSTVLVSVHLDPLAFVETRVLAALYVLLAPASLIVWLWLPHRAMVEARTRLLQPVGDALRGGLEDARLARDETSAAIKAGNNRLTELRRRYELLEQATPTWPLQVPALRGLSLTALFPLVTALLAAAGKALAPG